MKKIGIVTFCVWSSYGSIMQSIGLKETLKKLNCESFICYANPAPHKKLSIKFKFSKNPKTFLINIYNWLFSKKINRRYQTSNSFIKKNVNIIHYNDYKTLKSHPPKADCYIAGSDQIWHPHNCNPLFFLDFVDDKEWKFSYAASLGINIIPDNNKTKFQNLLSNFDSYSMREADSVESICKYIDNPISVHIDPTFLLDAETWRKYQNKYSITEPYILVYAIHWDTAFNKELVKLHKQSGLQIVCLSTGISKVYCNKRIIDASPEEFLWLIDNAEAVVTSSFHGLAFSLIFNKKFSAVINPKAPSRLKNILNVFNIDNCSISNVMNFDISQYSSFNSIVDEERKKSIEYLLECINKSEQHK